MMITEKEIYRCWLGIRMILRHNEENEQEELEFKSCLEKLGVTYTNEMWKKGGEMYYKFLIHVGRSKVALDGWEQELLNDDLVVKFLAIYSGSSISILGKQDICTSEFLDAADDIEYVLAKFNTRPYTPFFEQVFYSKKEHWMAVYLFREYTYPSIRILLNKILNYNLYDIVKKIKGMWV